MSNGTNILFNIGLFKLSELSPSWVLNVTEILESLLTSFGFSWLLLATFGYFWLLYATFGYFWLLLATFGYFRLFLATFWLLLATFCHFWLLLATFGYFCYFWLLFGYFWVLLAICDACGYFWLLLEPHAQFFLFFPSPIHWCSRHFWKWQIAIVVVGFFYLGKQ